MANKITLFTVVQESVFDTKVWSNSSMSLGAVQVYDKPESFQSRISRVNPSYLQVTYKVKSTGLSDCEKNFNLFKDSIS